MSVLSYIIAIELVPPFNFFPQGDLLSMSIPTILSQKREMEFSLVQ